MFGDCFKRHRRIKAIEWEDDSRAVVNRAKITQNHAKAMVKWHRETNAVSSWVSETLANEQPVV